MSCAFGHQLNFGRRWNQSLQLSANSSLAMLKSTSSSAAEQADCLASLANLRLVQGSSRFHFPQKTSELQEGPVWDGTRPQPLKEAQGTLLQNWLAPQCAGQVVLPWLHQRHLDCRTGTNTPFVPLSTPHNFRENLMSWFGPSYLPPFGFMEQAE